MSRAMQVETRWCALFGAEVSLLARALQDPHNQHLGPTRAARRGRTFLDVEEERGRKREKERETHEER